LDKSCDQNLFGAPAVFVTAEMFRRMVMYTKVIARKKEKHIIEIRERVCNGVIKQRIKIMIKNMKG